MEHIGNIVVNDNTSRKKAFDVPVVPPYKEEPFKGSKQIFDELGAKKLSQWILDQDRLLLTDTTMRDAHQSLMATRMRTVDLLKVAKSMNYNIRDIFSMEMWGGATFDVAYRFLHEDPWHRLDVLRKAMPNLLMQMLVRGNNTVGYKNYPDNVVKKFIKESSEGGIDIFRIFDSLNWIEGMRLAIEETIANGKIAEGTMCYTGDILDETRDKYTLEYYVNLAKELEKVGCHIIGIKDMSGLLKPYAAHKLVKALKNEISIPIHLHTHDTTGNGVATVLMAAEAGVDIADTAINSMSGLTSQPALNSVVAALENTSRSTRIDLDAIDRISAYWAAVRPVYENFESDLKSGTTEIYKYEIPGGQYSNLKPQVESFGLGHKFKEVKEMYKDVNQMVGDIIKVTPSSKMVGDMSIFMVQNDLTPENIYEKGANLDYPDSVVTYFKGMMGQPYGGFPEKLQKIVLKDEKPITVRPGKLLDPEDYEADKNYLRTIMDHEPSDRDVTSYSLYPKVFEEYVTNFTKYDQLWRMGSDVFFHGLQEGETAEISVDEGQKMIVTLVEIGRLKDDGKRTVTFEINGSRRSVDIEDHTRPMVSTGVSDTLMADENNPNQVGASIPGTVAKINVAVGDKVKESQPLMVLEAMKMETNVISPRDGVIAHISVKEGDSIESGQLLIELEGED